MRGGGGARVRAIARYHRDRRKQAFWVKLSAIARKQAIALASTQGSHKHTHVERLAYPRARRTWVKLRSSHVYLNGPVGRVREMW